MTTRQPKENAMTHLGGKPLGSVGRERADVLRELIEQIDDASNPLHVAAVAELDSADRPQENAMNEDYCDYCDYCEREGHTFNQCPARDDYDHDDES